MTLEDDHRKAPVGYASPPRSTRFKKGQSGNPKGRPPGRPKGSAEDAVLGQMVTLREDGRERSVTAAQALLLKVTQRGLDGDVAAAKMAREIIAKGNAIRHDQSPNTQLKIVRTVVAVGTVNAALESLRMAVKLDRYRDTSRMALEPWLVEAAMERLGDQRLSIQEQQEVYRATRTPSQVNWPEWWSYSPGTVREI
mgnify:CR=1 FL=1